jgi:hypothetical protein
VGGLPPEGSGGEGLVLELFDQYAWIATDASRTASAVPSSWTVTFQMCDPVWVNPPSAMVGITRSGLEQAPRSLKARAG